MADPEALSPVEQKERQIARWVVMGIGFVLSLVGCYLVRVFALSEPVVYNDIQEHFKYGSIGSEPVNGLPYWIWKVLPEMFPEKLPGNGYASLGFVFEPGHDLPIGFSKRRVIIDRVGLNCAICHTGTVRDTPASAPRIVLGMPANTFDLQAYFRFISACAADGRFTADNVVRTIETHTHLNPVDRLIYQQAVWLTREGLLARARQLAFMDSRPNWGPGRVDTFDPYKVIQFNFPMDHDDSIGTTDLPSIWNQKPRDGMHLHWDGDNTSLEERDKSAALGAGITPVTMDLRSMTRVENWLRDTLQPPSYPYTIDRTAAGQGASIYAAHCAGCHAFDGAQVGQVTPISDIGTDPHRLDSFTYDFSANMNSLFVGTPYRFSHFRKTQGYANVPLDGIWLRAPYLHNGSVPTLRDLLDTPDARPKVFYRGNDVYDSTKVGFVSIVAEENGRRYFRYDVRVPGNGNQGHLYGVDLSPAEKDALVEYLKTL
jgi:hypothetical protein